MRAWPLGLVTTIATFVSGCFAAYEPVGRPPTAGEVQRINALAIDQNSMRVEDDTPPRLPCAAGGCAAVDAAAEGRPKIEPIAIASCDAQQITFVTQEGPRSIAMVHVGGVSVLDRGRGAVVGAAVLTGVSLVTLIGAVAIAVQLDRTADGSSTKSSCDSCWKPALTLLVGSALVGAGIGYLVGSRHYYEFVHP